ncbi:protein fluG-like [Rosa chinensis]|uniref:protein fluG-like n=1 Tax=Rosa chinensis TaxID=74649 RepID=UPI001AD907E5|nr:protein fluG-like [Rosa chinensis]
MQIHTGFGDKDLDLRLSNPLHLRAVLEAKRFSKSRIVLLHASYPFSKEASYLASVYPQVYLDFGLAIPKLNVQGMVSSLKELLELAPIKKETVQRLRELVQFGDFSFFKVCGYVLVGHE